MSDRAARDIGAADPRYGFLASDAGLRECFVWGSVFPDIRAVPAAAASFDRLKARVEALSFVKQVRLSSQDVKPLGFDTHDRAFCEFLVGEAEASGHRPFLAFALGHLSHVVEDVHSQTAIVPHHMARTGAADLGIRPCESAAGLAAWGPGSEAEGIVEAMLDARLTAADARRVRELGQRLSSQGSVVRRLSDSLRREAEVKHLYWLAAKKYHDQVLGRSGFISEAGFQNSARLFEATLVFYAYGLGKESLGDAARVFQSRYIDLRWWAAALTTVGNWLVNIFTLGQRSIYDLVAGLALDPADVRSAAAGADPSGEVIFAFLHGGDEERRLRARLAGNVEFQRLLASGLLDRAGYASPLEVGAAWVADAARRRGASRFTDPARWSVWDRKVLMAGGLGGLAKLAGGPFAAEPAILVSRARFLDPASGAEVRELLYPRDIGKALRLEVEVFAPVADAQAILAGRDIEARVLLDLSRAQGQDPVHARLARRLSPTELNPVAYGSLPRPVLTLDLQAPADAGQAGLYVEVASARGVFFTSGMRHLAAVTAGRPHYARDYAEYGPYPPSVRIRR
jgi:hypothetical protein